MTTDEPTPPDATQELLIRRVRAALGFMLAGSVLFWGIDWLLSTGTRTVWPVPLLAQALLVLVVLIRLPRRTNESVTSGLLGVTVAFALAVLLGWWGQDVQVTTLLVITFTVLTATLVPWGAPTQAVVAILGSGALATTWYLVGELTGGIAGVCAFALLTSIYVAYEMAATRQRESGAEQERRRTAEALLLLESAVDQANDAVLIMTPELAFPGPQVLYVNPAFSRMSGFSVDETNERPLRALFGPGTDAQTIARLRSALGQTEPSIGEGTLHRKDGKPYTVEWHTGPVRNERGETTHWVTINRDVSERNRSATERALLAERLYATEQEQAQYSAALARVGEAMISSLDTPVLLDKLCELTTELLDCDCSHVFLWRQEEAAYVPVFSFGDVPEQWESLRLLKIPADTIATLVDRLMHQEVVPIIADGDSAEAKLFAQHGLTSSLCVGLRRGDEVIGFYAAHYRGKEEPFSARQEQLAKGIAHLASLGLDNARLVEQLERASRVKSDFVATMSHELRTPLNIIMGYQDLMLEGVFGSLTPEQNECLGTAQHRARDLLALINATLDISRLDQNRIPLDIKEIAISDFLDQITREIAEVTDKDGVVFACETSCNGDRLITDPTKLKIVLKNLVDNAMKFTDAGRVELSAERFEHGIEFSVSDTGIGIADEAQGSIFQAFHQLDGSSTRRHGGVGLGLYIVRRLIEMLKGEISLDSEPGKGSTFRVRIPHNALSQDTPVSAA